MKRVAAVAFAIIALAGCSSDKPLDAHTGTILAKRYTPEDTDCGGFNPVSGKYDPFYCETDPAEYFFMIKWDDRRFRSEETGKVRTEIGQVESGYQVDLDTWGNCLDGDSYTEGDGGFFTGASGACTREHRPS